MNAFANILHLSEFKQDCLEILILMFLLLPCKHVQVNYHELEGRAIHKQPPFFLIISLHPRKFQCNEHLLKLILQVRYHHYHDNFVVDHQDCDLCNARVYDNRILFFYSSECPIKCFEPAGFFCSQIAMWIESFFANGYYLLDFDETFGILIVILMWYQFFFIFLQNWLMPLYCVFFVCFSPEYYLPWAMSRFKAQNGKFVQRRIDSWDDFIDDKEWVISTNKF